MMQTEQLGGLKKIRVIWIRIKMVEKANKITLL